MKNYLKMELKTLLSSVKNRYIIIIVLLLGLFYTFEVAPKYDPIEKVNLTQTKMALADRQEFLEQVQLDEGTHPLVFFATEIFPEWNQLDIERIDSFSKRDYQKYAEETSKWYEFTDNIYNAKITEDLRYPIGYYTLNNYFAHYDGHYASKREAVKYKALARSEVPLSVNVFEERTALQTLVRESSVLLPLVIIISTVLLSADVVVKDFRHQSLAAGYPLLPMERILSKLIAVLFGFLLTILALLPVFFILSIKYGVGSLKLPVMIYNNNYLNDGAFHTMTIAKYLLVFGSLLGLIVFIIFFSIVLLSQVLPYEGLNIIAPICLFLLEPVYFRRGIGEYFPVQWLPSTFAKIGDIVTGHANYLYVTQSLNVQQMVLVLGLLLSVLLVSSYLLSRRMGRFI
ncbi:hypothetical protein [Vagococcus acidifermentans]|uniref:ABC transporter permease n=1 Tax=Vagococcus acidifermentans TaxID=564710 RepID=A0A430ARL2_9ENTE|nr:hypothetical protein [Vagococcus acidifermentans]RSU10695.1 hypothetical protein CBF27_10295 [Vagococcus acidifermentans]